MNIVMNEVRKILFRNINIEETLEMMKEDFSTTGYKSTDAVADRVIASDLYIHKEEN